VTVADVVVAVADSASLDVGLAAEAVVVVLVSAAAFPFLLLLGFTGFKARAFLVAAVVAVFCRLLLGCSNDKLSSSSLFVECFTPLLLLPFVSSACDDEPDEDDDDVTRCLRAALVKTILPCTPVFDFCPRQIYLTIY
jgi:hypothetical protein